MVDDFIERRIITGLIVSTEYLQRVQAAWNPRLLASVTAKTLSTWCWAYFNEYREAPNKDIEGIFNQHLNNGLPEDRAAAIEDILSGLSEQYGRKTFNVDYLHDETVRYFTERHLRLHADDIRNALEKGAPLDAEKLALSYASVLKEEHSSVDPFADAGRIRDAFQKKAAPLIRFPKALGQFWNDQLTRDAFIALEGPEKRGKSYMLMELAVRAVRSDCATVLFQAGDMSEHQLIRRLCIYLSQRSDQERYCHDLYLPVVDCQHNQDDSCNRKERECGFGVAEKGRALNFDELRKLSHEHVDYKPCHNCREYSGAVWLIPQEPTKHLVWTEAYKKAKEFRKHHAARFKLSTFPSGSLSVGQMKALLAIWERREGFVPDVIIVDYADILAPDPDFARLEFRHRTNEIWQRLRGLSQEQHCLVVTATQAAATSYGKEIISLEDFSEDKRKYGHVTAFYTLNQTPEEKKIGILRIGELLVREGDFDVGRSVKVLQRLQIGRPFLGSYF